MEKELQELESILKRELELHNSLCDIAQSFNNAIKENDLDLMQKHISEQDEKICTIEQVEMSRKNCFAKLSQHLNSPKSDFKLAALYEIVPVEWKNKLTHLHMLLKSTMSKLTRINTSNRILLEEATSIINKTFDIIWKSQDRLQSYSSQGKKTAHHRSGYALYNNVI